MHMLGRDIYVKYTDKDGKSFTQYHRVWDIGIFMAARESEAKKNGGKVEQVLKPSK